MNKINKEDRMDKRDKIDKAIFIILMPFTILMVLIAIIFNIFYLIWGLILAIRLDIHNLIVKISPLFFPMLALYLLYTAGKYMYILTH